MSPKERMSPKIQIAYYLLWFAHPVLQAAVAGVMLWRKLHHKFPIFFAYILSQILVFAVLFPVYHFGNEAEFFYTYWTGAVIGVALGFKVIHEIFLDVFRSYHTLKDLGSVLFRWAGLVMLLVAGVVAASSPATHEGPIVQSILTMQTSVRVIQCGLVLFLLVFSKYLGVSWRQHSFGIALGFGSFATVELLLIALGSSGLKTVDAQTRGLINMGAFNCAILLWLGYMLVKCPARELPAHLLQSQRWERSLTEIQPPSSAADSLIPMFEGMVDRALSKTNGNGAVTPHDVPVDRGPSLATSSDRFRFATLAPHRLPSKT